MNRFWVRTATCASVLAAVAVAAPAAQAHVTAAKPLDASALRAVGVKVTWPLAGGATVVAPGSTLSVRVQKLAGKRGVPVRVRLVRINAKDRATGILSSATVRRGTIKIAVPKAAGRVYALHLRAGTVRHVSRFSTTAAKKQGAPVPDAVPGDPMPIGDGPDTCAKTTKSTGSATLHLALTSVVAGQPVPYSIENTGPSCLTVGFPYHWERLVDGTWTGVEQNLVFILPAFFVPPGTSWDGTGSGWAAVAARTEPTFEPGRYRLVTDADYDSQPRTAPNFAADLVLTAEIDVVAPTP